MKLIVNKTVEVLSERVDQYEAQMYQPNWMDCVWTSLFRKAQMESLKKELQEISRNREEQVSKFKESYESLRVCQLT